MKSTFDIGTIRAERGRKLTGQIFPPDAVKDRAEAVDLILVHGKEPGPVVYIGAGSHGDEYNSMEAVRLASHFLDPLVLKGTVILVPYQNKAALLSHERHAPSDGLDLDVCFPGDPEGSPTEILAHVIFHQAVKKAQYLLDLHTASRNGCNLRYGTVAPPANDTEMALQVHRQSIKLASDFGCKLLSRIKPALPGRYLGQESGWDFRKNLFVQAADNGIASTIIEFGEAGRIDPVEIQAGFRGILRVLKGLSMVDWKDDENGSEAFNLFLATDTCAVRNRMEGFLYIHVKPGQRVEKGQTLAEVKNFPDRKEVLKSPADGMVIRICTNGLVNEEERIAVIGME